MLIKQTKLGRPQPHIHTMLAVGLAVFLLFYIFAIMLVIDQKHMRQFQSFRIHYNIGCPVDWCLKHHCKGHIQWTND